MTALAKSRPPTAAEIYDAQFVPALFKHWGPVLVREARIAPGQTVLDVACGTGVAALAALESVGARGKVTGLDANEEMLEVARRKSGKIDWRLGRAAELPFKDGSFDAVVSQFGMMFFTDPVAALREMMRVLKTGGRLAVAVCDAVDHSPGYAALVGLLDRLFGTKVGDAFRAPFVLGDPVRLRALCDSAGITDAKIAQHTESVCFASIKSLIAAERACVWTLGGMLDDAQFERLLREAEVGLKPFADRDGKVSFDMPALIITAGRRQ